MNNPVLHPNREQVEALVDLGGRLKQLREMKDLSLEQVAARTLVSKRMLAAIETATVEHLPEPVYIQGFIRRYADALGVNGAAFASEFPAEASLMPARRSTASRFSVQAQLRPLHLYLLYVVLVGAAVSGLSYVLSRNAAPVITIAAEPSKAVPTAPVNPTATTPHANPAAPSPVPAKSVQVAMKLTDQSWIRVITDGKMNFEGVLPQGSERLWTADKQIVVRAGNAGGVMVSLNHSQPKPLGLPGSVEEVTFGGNTNAQATAATTDTWTSQTLANSQLQPSF